MDEQAPDDNPFTAEHLALRDPPASLAARPPSQLRKRQQHFAIFPLAWAERLSGASGNTCLTAVWLLHQYWKSRGKPFAFGNAMLRIDGISRASKWRALAELEARGLIEIERRPRRSPIIQPRLP